MLLYLPPGGLFKHRVVRTVVIDLTAVLKNFHNVKIYMQFGMLQKAYLARGWGNDTRLLCYK